MLTETLVSGRRFRILARWSMASPTSLTGLRVVRGFDRNAELRGCDVRKWLATMLATEHADNYVYFE